MLETMKCFRTKINFLAIKRKYGETLNTATSKVELFMIKHEDYSYLAVVLKSSILDVARLLDRPLITFYPCFQFFLIKLPVSQVIDCFIYFLVFECAIRRNIHFISSVMFEKPFFALVTYL